MSSAECPALIDIAVISGFYSQMSGVLAGFAFTAMVFLLTPARSYLPSRPMRGGGGELLALFAAFVALVITTLLYSVLAGETAGQARPRAATAAIIDGVVFGLAVIMLFQGVTVLMQRTVVDRAVLAAARFVTVVAVPTLAFYYIVTGASDITSARARVVGSCDVSLPGLGIALTIALPAILSVSLAPRARRVPWRTYSSQLQLAAPLTVLAASVFAALLSGDISTRSPEFLPSTTVVHAYLVGYFILLLLLGLMLSYGETRQEEPQPEETSGEQPEEPDAPGERAEL
ncbi:hypothetical protein ABZ783_24800 [Micromonospora sp. NPDC047738]|uniref:hypothetical protein n=1 Tax=Micromonospora sp. NPDC047738 TaxID=3155741 RepID=UPI0033F295C4